MSVTKMMAVALAAGMAWTVSGCDDDGGADVADMVDKILSLTGILRPGGFLDIQLQAAGCPMLHEHAFLRVNGIEQTFDRGDNSGPGIGKGPCYFPGALVSLPEGGTHVTIEVGDDSQTVRTVLAPLSGGSVEFGQPPRIALGQEGGDVTLPFTWRGNGAAPPSFEAVGLLHTAMAIYQVRRGTVQQGAILFTLGPQLPATTTTEDLWLEVQVGLIASCENALCDATWMTVSDDFQPPPAQMQVPIDIAP